LHSPADVLIAIQTWSATILVLNLLAEQIAGRLALPACRKELERTVREVDQACEHYRRASLDWKPYFRPYNAIYLLSRGASQASACEGQLLFHEMAWHPATFYTAGHFRHGPWEVIEDGFLGFVFAPQDACYALNIGLATDIMRLQGQLALVTPNSPQNLPSGALTCRVASLPKALSPLVEIIPLQFFIYEFAIWKGHYPGEFRISTPVTLTEGETFDADS
jgi:glucosamine--fructose-6-phosphate aminotransferase (isomerizing)